MEPQPPEPPAQPAPDPRNRNLLTVFGLASLAMGAYVYQNHVRPALREWGTTADEQQACYPGDDLVPGATRRATSAISIDAPPMDVWPWLVQMGHRRAGWYAYDLVDNGGRRSAQRILPEHQTLHEGDPLPVDGRTDSGLRLARMDQERHICFTWSRPAACSDPTTLPTAPAAAWTFHLEPRGPHGTRLVVRTIGDGRHPLALAAGGPFSDHFAPVLQRRMLLGVKMRAERLYRIHRNRARRIRPQFAPPEA